MVREIVWTKRANRKFNHIISYLQKEWGESVTENFVRKSYLIIELLARQPEIGTMENPEKKIYGFLITKHNRLFYRTSNEELVILNFFDTRSSNKKKS